MLGIGRLASALILGIVLPEARAKAQDPTFMDMNMDMGCMLMAGMHEMQVSVYQSGASDDSCKDIPSPGPALITLSSGSKELRDMTTEVRIVRDTGAKTAASGNLDPATLAYLPPKNYPRGVITLPANFDKPGKYAVLVTVRDAQDMAIMSGRLGLTVGEASSQWIFVYILSGIILASAFGFYLRDLGRNKKMPIKSS